jgi:hypothetical protein
MNMYVENKIFFLCLVEVNIHSKNIELLVVRIDQLNDVVEFQAFVQQKLVTLKNKRSISVAVKIAFSNRLT